MTCKHCDQEVIGDPIEHVASCQHIPEEGRAQARQVLDARKAYASQEACCPLRKKILVHFSMSPKELCGVDDSAVADVMTFERFLGKNVLQPRFCMWCGAPWTVRGLKVL